MAIFMLRDKKETVDHMEELKSKLTEFLTDRLYQIIISNPRSMAGATKVKIRPIMLKGSLYFQETATKGTQVFHENHTAEEMAERILQYMNEEFRQLEAQSMEGRMTVLVSKKGKMTFKHTRSGQKESLVPDMSHNRTKHYLLKEGVPVPFLVDLGVQSPEGMILRSRYDKFKQINRYLEFVEDILPTLDKGKRVRIIDFGCGKSYLTFALYHYLHEVKGINVEITGLDLKADVIKKCNTLAESYGYEKLRFFQGDISTYCETGQVDMVVTLHACDTATDYAIKKAIEWKAKVIFAVPCCQHEVNKQIENELLAPVLKYGLLKERLSAILTDAIRANLLEEAGYETKVLEFIDMEHTPKNILIRAVRREDVAGRSSNIRQLTDACRVEMTLQKLMKDEDRISL